MDITPLPQHAQTIQGWTPSEAIVRAWCAGSEVSSTAEFRPCGCSVKLDLEQVVYPALREPGAQSLRGHDERVDAHAHPGRLAELRRWIVPLAASPAELSRIRQEMAAFGAQSVLELFTTSLDQFREPTETRAQFQRAVATKLQLLGGVDTDLKARQPGHSLSYGKGHSIGAGGNAHLFDLARYHPAAGLQTVSNHDTIITADSLLRHFSPVSIFTSLNNALNDLFVMGVTEGLRLYPALDGRPEEIERMSETLREYVDFYAARGVSITLIEQPPLGLGTCLIGATVLGEARHELPKISGLVPGQELIATRFFGDLSTLSHHRNLAMGSGAEPALEKARLDALQRMTTPNYLLAQVIQRYLPPLGSPPNPELHLTYATDLSGPGIAVLEEGARASGVDVYVEDLRFLHEPSLEFYRKNHTSSTNGPLLLAANPRLMEKIRADLMAIGLDQIWKVGRVLEPSEEPTVYVNPALQRRLEKPDPRTDFFAPEVHYQEGTNLKKIRTPIFQRFAFASR